MNSAPGVLQKNNGNNCLLRSAVTPYLESNKLPPFEFARQCRPRHACSHMYHV